MPRRWLCSSSSCRASTASRHWAGSRDLALFAVPFVLATSFMGQAAGSFFKHRETAVLVFVATTLPQFFLVGVSWPREMIPPAARPSAPHLSERVGDRRSGAHRSDGRPARRGEGGLALSVAACRGLFRARGGRVAAAGSDRSCRCRLAPASGPIRSRCVAALAAAAGILAFLILRPGIVAPAPAGSRPTDRDQDRPRNQRPPVAVRGCRRAKRAAGRHPRRACPIPNSKRRWCWQQAQLGQARAERDRVYAGPRQEEVDTRQRARSKWRSKPVLRAAAIYPDLAARCDRLRLAPGPRQGDCRGRDGACQPLPREGAIPGRPSRADARGARDRRCQGRECRGSRCGHRCARRKIAHSRAVGWDSCATRRGAGRGDRSGPAD